LGFSVSWAKDNVLIMSIKSSVSKINFFILNDLKGLLKRFIWRISCITPRDQL
jgi:hypothetical protein